tara:strand:- start:86 stop:1687 length:1602 start_codon:yes stop_codon:yes gene_type:complete
MANGRLGKAAVAPGATSALYTNSSGAEASVTVIAYAEAATNIDIRIDTTSNAVTETTTIVSESFDNSYIRYAVSNTGFTDSSAMAYVGRVQFNNKSNVQDLPVFEFYSNSGSTTYTVYNNSDAVSNTSQQRATYDVYTAEQVDTGGDIVIQDPGASDKKTFKSFPAPTTEDEYYKNVFNRTASASATYTQSITFGNDGVVVDPYPLEITGAGGAPDGKKMHWIVGIDNSEMVGVFKYTGNTFEQNHTGATLSVWYRATSSTSMGNPSTTTPYAYLRLQRRVGCIDPHGQNGNVALWTMDDSKWNSTSVGTAAGHSVHYSHNSLYRISSGLSDRTAGIVLYFEYNPNDGKYYCATREGSSAKLFTTTRDDLLTIGAGNRINGTWGTSDDYVTYDSSFDLTLSTYSMNDQQVCFRSMRIGTSLWVLVVSEYSQTTTEEVFYSTDLITWTAAATFYGSVDYTATQGVATITSNSGTVSATKTRIGVLGTDGILEQDLFMVQYERTGIVLSNGDRILVRNRGTTQTAVVQVMGYEGS